MPDSNADKLVLELVACDRCKNPFMMQKGEKLRKQENNEEIVCENCLKLEQRKKKLVSSVVESQKEIKTSIKEYESQLELEKLQEKKKIYYDKIKQQSEILTKSVELLKKIEETNNEKYIEEYKKLFEKMKRESS
ncbi:MAG: hypothetical protein HWN81_19635 [Candidatus Lokiarchaeota archaeon]|nr:hypothetical protein [Candidatus Lokiarchaeota archaeon]